MRPTRRELLRTFGLIGAASATGCVPEGAGGTGRTPDPDAPWSGAGDPDDALFAAGVSSGDPLPDGAILWTRYGGDASLDVIVAAWDGAAWVEQAPEAVAVEGTGHVHHDLRGRAPDEPLAFQFVDGDGRYSRVGHTRTAMAPGTTGLVRLGASSCTHQSHPGYPSQLAAMGRGPLDGFLWLGDFGYFDGRTTEAQYQALWQQQQRDEAMRAILAATPSMFTWDDHEVGNNWNADPDFDPERLQTAWDAFFANTPTRRNAAAPQRIWRSFRFGRTAEVFVLDCRGERELWNERYLSDAQLSWMIDGIASSPCTWKVVANSVPIANLPAPYDIDEVIIDRWEGFPEQRQAVLDGLAGVPGVIFVSGDIHHPALMRVEPEGPASGMFDFIVGPGGSNTNPLGDLMTESEGVIWSASRRNTARLELSPLGLARLHVIGEEDEDWMTAWVDPQGNVLDVMEASA